MRNLIAELMATAMTIVLSADLLYLFYKKAWYDPIKLIEVSELIMLYSFIILGISWFIFRVRENLVNGKVK